MSNSTLTIHRIPQILNKARPIDIYLDGQKVKSIFDGETVRLDISSGSHEIFAKIDWCSSPKVMCSVIPGEIKAFELGSPISLIVFAKSTVRAIIIFVGILLKTPLYRHAKKTIIDSYIPYIISAMLLWFLFDIIRSKKSDLLYFLTIGRNEYLYLKEI
ncbi:MAG: hypothetical protein A3F91_10735 [Flavobacteria bacterium RIFCSPLOWO2_12_FULL_35_11]|nr:MAG: hypothetical protein A3F91_10735 [Flavobacteria bacterium RIFCSPLOWO2_12_FULL_35_11]